MNPHWNWDLPRALTIMYTIFLLAAAYAASAFDGNDVRVKSILLLAFCFDACLRLARLSSAKRVNQRPVRYPLSLSVCFLF
jgi:hypothetical protein